MLALCIDLGGTAIKIGLLDEDRVVAAKELLVSGVPSDLDAVREDVAVIRATSAPDEPLAGVALAVPGIVDQANGALVAAHDKYGYAIGMDLRAWATESFEATAHIENDARAALLGESTFGVARGAMDAVLMTLGTGIGTAAMMNGQLIRGAHEYAAILGGHVTVDIDGPACNCGNLGCAEALASTWSLPRAIRQHPDFATSEIWPHRLRAGRVGISDLLEMDDAIAQDVLDRFLKIWAAATVTLCHAYDPSVVVLTGGVMRAASRILPSIQAYVDAHLWSSFPRPRILTPDRPDLSVLLGLSALIESRDRKDAL